MHLRRRIHGRCRASMTKPTTGRIVALVVLGVLALRSLDVRGIERASDVGDLATMLGILTVPMLFVLAMIGVMFWGRKKPPVEDVKMFTYKFLGLNKEDAPTPYYY